MTLPVVWIPEANEDLQEARAWYDKMRPELGERFARAVEVTVEAIAKHPLQFPVVYRNRRRAGVRRRGDSTKRVSQRTKETMRMAIPPETTFISD